MRRVVKIGGSLLLREDLPAAITNWLAACEPESETMIIIGGGQLIDAIRNLDRVRPIDATTTHWLCVDLLETTRRLFSSWFPWPSLGTSREFEVALENGLPQEVPVVVSVGAFYGRHLPSDPRFELPRDWRTTTDAIAALLAIQVEADELVLLKSCDVNSRASIQQLVSECVVDEALPLVASQVKAIRVEKLPPMDDGIPSQ